MAKGGYRGNPMGGGINANMIKQAQKMQQDMLRMQEEMESKEYDATVGGGMVKAVVNGKHTLLSIEINPEAVDPDDVEMLQDMVVAAVNEAMRKAETEASATMSKLTGSLNLGGLGGLF
ncbi:MAG: YbaB/EbfC family nucleoid-associated protein [Oscillospiraceae bacterium]|nr:YbaB/EbfC family nucleoid-associated protein [Oscillospiraceae bacterium]MBR4194294.1 YbaB/EbfC family nucleoid-associated protein [Oscillospiraceae bacterium]MBR4656398.1 YbaB/EbfC family nucleoid-associated protein [Oscillospiraceae bacterium]